MSYGSSAAGDEFAMLTAVVSGSNSFKFISPITGPGTGGPLLSGLVVHSIAPPSGQPTSTNTSLIPAEDTQALLTTNDFGTYSDSSSQPLAAVKITTLPSTGCLEYDTTGAGAWAAVTVDQEISAANLTAGRLRFFPAPDGNDTLQTIQVTQLPTAGTLMLNAVAVTFDQGIPVADITAGLLKIMPAPNASGSAYATFGFKVSDGNFYRPRKFFSVKSSD